MTLVSLLRLWRARLSSRAMRVQEALAVVGIAVGVALLFASQVASTSLSGSVQQLTNEIVGRNQQVQIDARGPSGFDELLLERVSRLPGVRGVAPVLEESATVIGPKGSQAVLLLGTTPQFAASGGPIVQRLSTRPLAHIHAIALPQPIGEAIGASSLESIKIQFGARIVRTLLAATLSEQQIGGLVGSPVAVAPLAYVQKITGMPGRLSRIFVRAASGRAAFVSRELSVLAHHAHVNVEPSNFDSKLFAVASNPETQSETLFSVISALVGFLFAFTAILLTVPRRRKYIEELWPHGASYGITFEILLFDAAVLAILGCTLGLLLGDALSSASFDRTPGYLASAFPIGDSRIITFKSVILAVLAGSASAAGGVLWPMRELLLRTSTLQPSRRMTILRLLVAAICVTVTTIILIAHPQDAFLGSATLIVALLALMPTAFHAVLFAFERVQRLSIGGAATELAVDSMRAPRVRVRALAIAVLSGVAVFGTISIGGAETSLRRGLYSSANAVSFSANIWVSPGGQTSPLSTTPFAPTALLHIERLPGVASVGIYRGSFFDWGDRRVWVLAPPTNSRAPIPAGQLISGRLNTANTRIRDGGWAILSEALAHENHLHIGDNFTLPSPNPITLRVAALTTNLGWPPGAVILNTTEYARAWGSNPSAYEIQTHTGFSPATVRNSVQHALGPSAGLTAETSSERRARDYTVINQGLSRLTQIKLLVLLASGLALAGAMTSMIWQRRERIAAIRLQGYSPLVLWQWLCTESALTLATGCSMGAIFGIAGQLLLSHTLAAVTGFPISLGVETTIVLTSFAWTAALALTIATVPGTIAVQVSPRATTATL